MTTAPVVLNPDAATDGSGSNARAHTRLYRDGVCVLHDFPVADISEHLRDPASVVWLDLCRPTSADFDMIDAEFGLHELAVRMRCTSPNVPSSTATPPTCSSARTPSPSTRERSGSTSSEIAVFITDQR